MEIQVILNNIDYLFEEWEDQLIKKRIDMDIVHRQTGKSLEDILKRKHFLFV
jgi:hypothetical protein